MELPTGIAQRGFSFQAKVKLGKTRHAGTFPSIGAAEAWLKAAREAYRVGKPVPASEDFREIAKVLSIQDIFDRVWAKRWRHLKSAKDDGSPGNATRFVNWCGPNMPASDALQEDHILAFLAEREASGVSDSTLTHYQAAIGPLVREAIRLRIVTLAPEMPKRKKGAVRLRVLEEAEEKAMLQVLTQWGYHHHRALFEFLLDTGVRPGEAQKLKWSDFEDTRVHLEAEITKNSTRRTLGLTRRAKEASVAGSAWARCFSEVAKDGPFTWADPKLRETRTVVQKLREHFGWDDTFVVYTFRHTCLSRLVRRGVDLYKVQIWAGHKSILQTQRYAKFAPKQITDLADVLES